MTLVTEAHTDDVPEGHMVFAILDQRGDTKLIWDKTKTDEVAAARALFATLVNDKKYQAFSVKDDGTASTRVTRFDPEAEKLIFVPAMVGG